MPYIKQTIRDRITVFDPFSVLQPDECNAGTLNYILTRIVMKYLHAQGWSYQTMNDIVGALEQAKDEFQRRIVHPYEETKKAANGDVYL